MRQRAAAASAVVTRTGTADRGSLDEHAADLAACLSPAAERGQPVGLWVEDAQPFVASVLAARTAGIELFVLPPTSAPARVGDLCAIEGAYGVLCDPERARDVPGGRERASVCGLALVSTGNDASARRPEPGSLHFFTSGTDGRPKGVVRSRASLELEDRTVGSHLGMSAETTVLCAVPPSHGYGFTAGVFAPLSFGGTSVVLSPRMPASLAKALAAYEPEIVVGVPAQYAAWSQLRESYRGPSPRLWLCGGAPLPRAVRDRFQDAWGGVIAEQYGMTECGAVSVDLDGAETLGRPYPGVQITIDEDRTSAEAGEVVIACPYSPQGYLDDPAAHRFTAEGFRTGDSGWFDAAGRLHLTGRRAHQLNVRGRKVDPTEIERVFWALDGVHEVAVIGIDRADGDQWIAAFVVGATSLTDEALRRATADLDAYKRPQRILRLDRLPRTAVGKTDFSALRATVAG